ncbi:MAG: ABC transporter permease [Dehalococcoidia bacterium]|jgi:putative ABC transport system permease protein
MVGSLRVAILLAFTSVTKGNFRIALLTMLILILVALNLVFVPGLLDGLAWGANDKLINTYSSDIVIESDGASHYIADIEHLLTEIEQIEGIESATARNYLGAEIEHGGKYLGAAVYGVWPDTEAAVFTIADSIVEGSYLDADDVDTIVLGIQIAGADRSDLELYARSLQNVHAGDIVSVTYTNNVEKEYTVKGIFYTEFIQTDLQSYVSEREFETVAPLLANNASAIYVKTIEGADTDEITSQIVSTADGLRVTTWEDHAGLVDSMTGSFKIIEIIIDAVNLMVAGITIFIVTYIDVAHRKRQIGIQRAIGITPASITLSYIIRAIFYSIIALALAMLIYRFGIIPLEAHYPFHFPFGDVFLRISSFVLIRTALLLFAVSVISALLPVHGVIRTKIINSIWG